MADKVTVPIYYEGRVAKLGLNQSELPKIDGEFEAIREGEELTIRSAENEMGVARSVGRESEADRAGRRR